jgi:hypothetical protein
VIELTGHYTQIHGSRRHAWTRPTVDVKDLHARVTRAHVGGTCLIDIAAQYIPSHNIPYAVSLLAHLGACKAQDSRLTSEDSSVAVRKSRSSPQRDLARFIEI